jgi:hypothetical protein
VIGGYRDLTKPSERVRRRRNAPVRHLFALWLMGVLLTVQARALPIHLGFVFLRGDEEAMTEGCDQKTCCTALCYLDQDGNHHCVQKPGHSCECGISTNGLDQHPMLLMIPANLPKEEKLLPDLILAGWIIRTNKPVASFYPGIPPPPPK